MNTDQIKRGGVIFALACGLAASPQAQAGTQHVVVNTSALNGDGTCYLEFTLIDGSGSGNGNSSASITNFLLNGGSLGSVLPPTFGSVTGSLGSTLTLADTSVLNDFAQGFTITNPSSTISFDLTLANTSVDGTPDAFTLQILDNTQFAVLTSGPTGTEFVRSDFTTTSPSATGYTSTDPGYTPPITATISSGPTVPEPGTWTTLVIGAFSIGALLLRSRRRSGNS